MESIKDIVAASLTKEAASICLSSLAVILAVQFFIKTWTSRAKMRETDKKIANRRQLAEKRKETVKKQCSYAVDSEEAIVNKPAAKLVEDIKAGKLTAVDVLHAYQRKAFEENTKLNFITDPIPEAEEQAQDLDNTKDKSGLLFGVPVSIKENLFMKGYDCTSGLSMYLDIIREEDSAVVKVLKAHGAIPFVRTNIPQACFSYCCSNPIFNETSNPQDPLRGPGGSSGGEGAILGCGASVIGVGNDIGGSLRIPAEFCGVYSLKPSVGRLSLNGMDLFFEGNTAVQATNGPMARDMDSLVLLSRALMSPEMYQMDPTLARQPFDLKEYEKKGPLRIGYFTFDGVTKCQPSSVRAVEEAKAALEQSGHELVQFEFPDFKNKGQVFPASECFGSVILPDSGRGVIQALVNDRVDDSLRLFRITSGIPTWVSKVMKYFFGKDRHLAMMLNMSIGYKSVDGFLSKVKGKLEWERSFLKAWQDQGLDAVICPVFPTPPPLKEIMKDVTTASTYSQLFNSLDYPAGVIPVTKVTQEDVDKTFDPTVYSPDTMVEKLMLKSAENAQGLSVGVQVATLPFKEELCLRVMRDLNTSLGRL